MRTLIKDVCVVTLDKAGTVLPNASIAIEGKRIVAVGEPPRGFRPDHTIDGYNHAAVPGFFNTHTHAAMTLMRGHAEDLPPERWFRERIQPLEAALTEEDVYWGAALGVCEMIRSGTVAFNDHYFFMDRVAQVVEESGMKAGLAWAVVGVPELEIGGSSLARALAFSERWQGGAGGRIRTVLGPHSPYLCPEPFLREVAAAAREHSLPIHIHVAETAQQVTDSVKAHGLTPIAFLEDCGIFDVPCLAAHAIHATPQDLGILAARDVSVSHCPLSYMNFGLEVNDLASVMRAGVRVGLGSDGPASNNDMDMKGIVRSTPLVQKFRNRNAEDMPGDLPLRMATRNGARAMGFPESGVLAAGRAADVVLFDIDRPHLHPRHNLVANLVQSARASDVSHVIADGRPLYRKGQLLTLDEEKIMAEAEQRAQRLIRRAPPKTSAH